MSPARVFRIFWYALLLAPVITIGLALQGASARSADEALGEAFCMAPLMGAILILAIIVFLQTLSSSAGQSERRIVRLLCVSVVPLFFLASGTSWQLGWPNGGQSVGASIGMLALNAVWLGLVAYAGRTVQRLQATRERRPT